MTSPESRAKLLDALELDLVGPWPGHAFQDELLPENPTRWYLTGYLVPESAPVEHRSDAEAKEEIDAAGEGGGMDDTGTPDKVATPPSLLPSSMGLSVLVSSSTTAIKVEVTWGTYNWEDPTREEPEPEDQGLGVKLVDPSLYPVTGDGPATNAELTDPAAEAPAPKRGFRRTPHRETVAVPLPASDGRPHTCPVPHSEGLRLVVTLRPVAADGHGRIPPGTRALCVFLVNGRPAGDKAYQGNAFQAHLRLACAEGFVARPDLRGTDPAASMDAKVADLQFRRAFDYASGIGCAAEPVDFIEGQPCHQVQTCWMPSAEVEFIGHLEASALPGVELRMEALAGGPRDSWTCCSSRRAAARPRPTWGWRRSRCVLAAAAHPGLRSAGVSVLMRYTLRLLTLDQLGRAATLVCALELERQRTRRQARRLAV
jgi:hypothetical protein